MRDLNSAVRVRCVPLCALCVVAATCGVGTAGNDSVFRDLTRASALLARRGYAFNVYEDPHGFCPEFWYLPPALTCCVASERFLRRS